jgi:hypothetical protein
VKSKELKKMVAQWMKEFQYDPGIFIPSLIIRYLTQSSWCLAI